MAALLIVFAEFQLLSPNGSKVKVHRTKSILVLSSCSSLHTFVPLNKHWNRLFLICIEGYPGCSFHKNRRKIFTKLNTHFITIYSICFYKTCLFVRRVGVGVADVFLPACQKSHCLLWPASFCHVKCCQFCKLHTLCMNAGVRSDAGMEMPMPVWLCVDLIEPAVESVPARASRLAAWKQLVCVGNMDRKISAGRLLLLPSLQPHICFSYFFSVLSWAALIFFFISSQSILHTSVLLSLFRSRPPDSRSSPSAVVPRILRSPPTSPCQSVTPILRNKLFLLFSLVFYLFLALSAWQPN